MKNELTTSHIDGSMPSFEEGLSAERARMTAIAERGRGAVLEALIREEAPAAPWSMPRLFAPALVCACALVLLAAGVWWISQQPSAGFDVLQAAKPSADETVPGQAHYLVLEADAAAPAAGSHASLAKAVAAAPAGGLIRIDASQGQALSDEGIRIDKALRIEAVGGSVRIGSPRQTS